MCPPSLFIIYFERGDTFAVGYTIISLAKAKRKKKGVKLTDKQHTSLTGINLLVGFNFKAGVELWALSLVLILLFSRTVISSAVSSNWRVLKRQLTPKSINTRFSYIIDCSASWMLASLWWYGKKLVPMWKLLTKISAVSFSYLCFGLMSTTSRVPSSSIYWCKSVKGALADTGRKTTGQYSSSRFLSVWVKSLVSPLSLLCSWLVGRICLKTMTSELSLHTFKMSNVSNQWFWVIWLRGSMLNIK